MCVYFDDDDVDDDEYLCVYMYLWTLLLDCVSCVSVCLAVRLCVCVSVCVSSVCLSVCLSVWCTSFSCSIFECPAFLGKHWNSECPDTREFPGADFKKWSGERTEVRMKSHAERALHSSAYVPPLVIRHVRCVFKYDGHVVDVFCVSVCLSVCLSVLSVCLFNCLCVCLFVCLFVWVFSGEHVCWNFSIHWNLECPNTREFPGTDFEKWSGVRTEVRRKSHAERALHSSAHVPPLVIRHVRCVFKYDGHVVHAFCESVCLSVC